MLSVCVQFIEAYDAGRQTATILNALLGGESYEFDAKHGWSAAENGVSRFEVSCT